MHGSLKWKESRCRDGKTLEMSLFGCMRILELRQISKVDEWPRPYIATKVLQACGATENG
jgi:hypothetical protein